MGFRRLGVTKEERTAQVIGRALSDFTLDLEAVGFYLSKQPYTIFSRGLTVLESAEYNKENVEQLRLGYYNDRLL
jgi:hypothetical protein